MLFSCHVMFLCDPMDYSTPGFPVHHQLPELAQTHVHRVSDAIQPSPVAPFSSCPFPESGSFPMSRLFVSVYWLTLKIMISFRHPEKCKEHNKYPRFHLLNLTNVSIFPCFRSSFKTKLDYTSDVVDK